jgi:hypothetical protein
VSQVLISVQLALARQDAGPGPAFPISIEEAPLMSANGIPSIVFVLGLWADGSCFSKLIPILQAEGFEISSGSNDYCGANVRTPNRVVRPIQHRKLLSFTL